MTQSPGLITIQTTPRHWTVHGLRASNIESMGNSRRQGYCRNVIMYKCVHMQTCETYWFKLFACQLYYDQCFIFYYLNTYCKKRFWVGFWSKMAGTSRIWVLGLLQAGHCMHKDDVIYLYDKQKNPEGTQTLLKRQDGGVKHQLQRLAMASAWRGTNQKEIKSGGGEGEME